MRLVRLHALLFVVIALTLSGCGQVSLAQRLNLRHSHPSRDGDVVVVNEAKPGLPVDLKPFVVYGKYTVVEFTSDR